MVVIECAYGLVGMGALFAAASRAPATSVLIIFELTDDYRIVLPQLAAIAAATPVSHLGIELTGNGETGPLARLSVEDVMQQPPPALPWDLRAGSAAQRFATAGARRPSGLPPPRVSRQTPTHGYVSRKGDGLELVHEMC